MFNLLYMQSRVFKCAGLNFLFVLFVIIKNEQVSSSPECAYKIFAQDHTMCKYNTPACSIIRGGLNHEEQQEVIRAHNVARQKVATGHQQDQPGASNMREVDWCDELALIAQRWAEQCTSASDQNRRTKMYEHVGQNVFLSHSAIKTAEADVQNAVQAWFTEVKTPGFNATWINPFHFNQSVAHYTQLLWADVDAIGCGFVHFQKSDKMYSKLTVCNYATVGNFKEGVMYKLGAQCSNCTDGCSTTYPGLCNKHVIETPNAANHSLTPVSSNMDEEIVSASGTPRASKDKGLKIGLVDNDEGNLEFLEANATSRANKAKAR